MPSTTKQAERDERQSLLAEEVDDVIADDASTEEFTNIEYINTDDDLTEAEVPEVDRPHKRESGPAHTAVFTKPSPDVSMPTNAIGGIPVGIIPETGAIVAPALSYSYPKNETAQIVTVSFWMALIPILIIGVNLVILFAIAMYPYTAIPSLLVYICWVSTLDRKAELKGAWGGRMGVGKWFFELGIWDLFRGYFDARLVKTCDLRTDQNYIVCAHPHGVYALGTFANWSSNTKVMEALFPKISIFPTTLPLNFRLPIWREFLLSMGMVSVDRKGLEAVVKPVKGACGRALLLITGGGEEFLHMEPRTMDLVIKKRKGFCKLALHSGAALVPMITFGENDIFVRVETPFSKKMTEITQRMGKFAFPSFVGRWGIFPHQKRLVTVVGSPLEVTVVEHPTEDQINDLHVRYLQHLTALYDEYKDLFHKDRIRDMEFIK